MKAKPQSECLCQQVFDGRWYVVISWKDGDKITHGKPFIVNDFTMLEKMLEHDLEKLSGFKLIPSEWSTVEIKNQCYFKSFVCPLPKRQLKKLLINDIINQRIEKPEKPQYLGLRAYAKENQPENGAT